MMQASDYTDDVVLGLAESQAAYRQRVVADALARVQSRQRSRLFVLYTALGMVLGANVGFWLGFAWVVHNVTGVG